MRTLSIFAFVMIVVLWSTPSTADTGIKLHLGGQFGVEFVTFTGDGGTLPPFSEVEPDYLAGSMVGGVLTVEFKEYFALRSGILYTQTGAEWDWTIPLGGDTTGTANLYTRPAYFQIPLLAKFTLPTEGRFKPYLYAGPAWLHNTSSELRIEEEEFLGGIKQRYYEKFYSEVHNAKKDQFLGIIGAGCDVVWGKVRVSLEGQYARGLTTVFDDVPDTSVITADKVAVLNDLSGAGADFKHGIFSINILVSYQLR